MKSSLKKKIKKVEQIFLLHFTLSLSFLLFNSAGWLEDAAYFAAIDNRLNYFSWYEWPEPLKNRHLSALEDVYQRERDFVRIE